MTAMFNPSITGPYPSTNSAYREKVINMYDSTRPDDLSEVDVPNSQQSVNHLPLVHILDVNENLKLVPFPKVVASHGSVITDHRGSLKPTSNLELVPESPEFSRVDSPLNDQD